MQGRDNETTESLLSQSVISTPSQSISDNKSDQFKKATKSTKIKNDEKQREESNLIDDQLGAGFGAMSVMMPPNGVRKEPSLSNATETNHKEQTLKDFIRESIAFAGINDQNLRLGKQVLTLQKKVNSLYGEIAKLQNAAKEEKQQHNSEASEQTKKIEDLKLKIKELKNTIQSLESTLSVMKDEQKKRATEYETQVSQLEEEKKELNDAIGALEIKLQAANSSISKLKELNKMLKNRLLLQDPSVQATAAEEERQKSNLQSELQQLINHTEEGSNIYSHLRKEIAALQSQLEIANTGNKTLMEANRKLQDDLEAKDKKITELKNQLETANTGNKTLVEANRKLQDDLKDKDKEITELNKAVEGAEKAIENAEKSFKSMCNIALATCAFFILTTITLAVTCVYMMTQNAESVMNSVLSNSGPELTR